MSISSEQVRSTKSRPYRMTKRAESVDDTRRQIHRGSRAAPRDHQPGRDPHRRRGRGSGRHAPDRLPPFADIDALFSACRAHFRTENPIPDPAAWAGIAGLEPRARAALSAMYAWFAEHGEELFPIYRDLTTMPRSTQAR